MLFSEDNLPHNFTQFKPVIIPVKYATRILQNRQIIVSAVNCEITSNTFHKNSRHDYAVSDQQYISAGVYNLSIDIPQQIAIIIVYQGIRNLISSPDSQHSDGMIRNLINDYNNLVANKLMTRGYTSTKDIRERITLYNKIVNISSITTKLSSDIRLPYWKNIKSKENLFTTLNAFIHG